MNELQQSQDKLNKMSTDTMSTTFLQTPQPPTSPLPPLSPRDRAYSLPDYIPSIKMLHLATLHRLNASRSKRTVTSKKTLSRSKAKSSDTLGFDCFGLAEVRSSAPPSESTDHDFHEEFNYEDMDPDEIGHRSQVSDTETVCQKTYSKVCAAYKITPSSGIYKGLKTKEISLKNIDIGPSGTKACAIALTANGTVENLDLEGNNIGAEGARYICEMLLENSFITELNLSENRLGTEGLKVVCDILRINENIRKVNLSGNGFGENDAIHIKEMLEDNITLKDLNISHNEFREVGGEHLAQAIAKDVSLEVLDLSWNHLRRRGATAIAKSLEKNLGIQKLSLGWNGFYLDGCSELGDSLLSNSTLQELDMTSNRIDRECLVHLLEAFRRNDTLLHLNLSNNPIGADGAMDIVEALTQYPNTKLKTIDIHTQTVEASFVKKINEIPHITIMYGVPSSMDASDNVDQDQLFCNDDPMMVLMEFSRLKNLRLVDLFRGMDSDNSGSLSYAEFKEGLLKAGVPLGDKGLNQLVRKLDQDSDGEVDFSELLIGQKDHKKKVHKLKQRNNDSNKPFNKTQIGIISAKLQSVFEMQRIIEQKKIKEQRGGKLGKYSLATVVGNLVKDQG